MSTATTQTADEESPASPTPWSLRIVLLLLGALFLGAFVYANNRTEEFRLEFPRFLPWLWNLYLTCALTGVAGCVALWCSRRWGFWLVLGSGLVAIAIGVYAMGFSLIGAGVAGALAVVWLAARPHWESLA